MNDLKEICHQQHLYKAIRVLFPYTNIVQNARREATIRNEVTGYPLELDIWTPELSLGFEFQDAYHYVAMWYVNVPLSYVQKKDNKKHEDVRRLGSTVITVPCWWDANLGSLVSTILFHRPDLELLVNTSPIVTKLPPVPLNPPPMFFSRTMIPGVGEPMLASFISTISSLSNAIFDHTYWWLGEKYDGIHCVWHPLDRMIYTRRGRQVNISESHIQPLYSITEFVEGEIWNGRGMFLESQKIVEQTSISELPFTRIVVFDSPSPKMQLLPYENRYQQILWTVTHDHPFINISYRSKCFSTLQLHKTLKLIIDEGGEGVMIRMPKSVYEPGRSTLLIKFKASLGDSEALVVSVEGDKVDLQLPSGTIFELEQSFKSSLAPKKGDIVTIEYDNFLRKDVPANPKIVRIRDDLSWGDVLYDFVSNSPQPYDEKTLAFITKRTGYWTKDNGKNLRLFLEDFARKRNLDPLLAETWYNIPGRLFEDTKARYIIYQEGSFANTLIKIFPELDFDIRKFVYLPKRHYMVVANRKYFFDTLAKQHNFDPLIPENWYSLPAAFIFDKTEAYSFVSTYYQGNYQDALQHIYPDIGLEATKFSNQQNRFLDSMAFKRRFFERFARANEFDPLMAENWYNVIDNDVKAQKHAIRVLQDYTQSVPRALIHVFPNIGLVLDRFRSLPRGYWTRHKNRKQFFDDYARNNGFDPLVASNWSQQQSAQFLSVKHAYNVMHYYNGNFRKALNQIYPSLGITQLQPRGHWASVQVQRELFDSFARERGFDPLVPDNWYNVSYYALNEMKHAASVMAHYKGSMKAALMSLYPNIGLNNDKFRVVTYYKHKSNRKLFFDKFAAEHGFDPLIPADWLSVDEQLIKNRPGARHVLKYYGRSVRTALEDVYPLAG